MKFLISESKIVGVMEKYLDIQEFILIKRDMKTYFVKSEDDDTAIIMYDHENGMCYIDYDLITELDDVFSSKYIVTDNVIASWVEDKLNVKVLGTNSWIGNVSTLLKVPK